MVEHKPIATDHIKGFYTYLETLDWSEPWLYCLCGLHLFLLALVWRTRKAGYVQIGIFFTLLGLVFKSEDLNEYLAKNHKLFTDHQYFDSPGLFISVVMSLPFLLICCFIVCLWFLESAVLMRELRVKKELRRQQQQQQHQQQQQQQDEDENGEPSPRRRGRRKKQD